jgi:hypothetical protein
MQAFGKRFSINQWKETFRMHRFTASGKVLQALGFDGFLPGRDVDFDKTRRALVDYAQFQE